MTALLTHGVHAGLVSFFSTTWLIQVLWHFSHGRGMLGDQLQLHDPWSGVDSRDHTYVAVSTVVHHGLAPLWLAIYSVRTFLWVLSCGLLCGRKMHHKAA
jgi:hypothetical protein